MELLDKFRELAISGYPDEQGCRKESGMPTASPLWTTLTDEEETELTASTTDNYRGRHLGCIQISNRPSGNFFKKILLENSDVGIDFICERVGVVNGVGNWTEHDEGVANDNSCAKDNSFSNCIFNGETAIWLNDKNDEVGALLLDPGNPGAPVEQTPGGTLADGTSVKVKGAQFGHCTFYGDRAVGVMVNTLLWLRLGMRPPTISTTASSRISTLLQQ